VQEKTCEQLHRVQYEGMNMITIQKQHMTWIRRSLAVGSTARMEKLNASLRIAAHYARRARS
jgi:hypothetical protein